MDYLPDFETAVTYTAFLIPVAITTYRMLQSPTMRTILMDLAKVLAVTSMLDLVRAVPAPSPEPQLIVPGISAPTTITLPISQVMSTGLVATTLTLPYDEVFSSVMPGIVQVSPLPSPFPTTFSTHTYSQLTSPEKRNEEDANSLISSPNPAYATLNTLAALPDAFKLHPDPFTPTCATSALRALWKWRSDCDRTLFAHLNAHCWTRAPSIESCCNDPDSQSSDPDPIAGLKVGKDIIQKSAPSSCRKYWPNTRAEEFMCCERVGDGEEAPEWCAGKDGWDKGFGRNVCECAGKTRACMIE